MAAYRGEMFPEYSVQAITNGVHAATWIQPSMQAMLDEKVPSWRRDNLYLRFAIGISPSEIRSRHLDAKRKLIDTVRERAGVPLQEDNFTIGFARRAAAYKRADMLFADPVRLSRLAEEFGGIQIVYAGKAHPHDDVGKAIIHHVIEASAKLNSDHIRIVYLENYEWDLGAILTAGADLWLNTPRRPYEASGTSGMKAAMNGVPSLSTLDGWWIEGCIEGATGWAIAESEDEAQEAESLYEKLENEILPLYLSLPRPLGRDHAHGHGHQRLFLQHPPYALPVRHQRLLPGDAPASAKISARARPDSLRSMHGHGIEETVPI